MKKNSLLKALLILFGVLVILTWIIPSGSYSGNFISGKIDPVGIFDLFKYPLYTFSTFIDYGIVILSIGIFYGILSKTEVYSKVCDDITDKIKKKKLFLGIIIFMLCSLSSLVGSPFVLFITVPFIYDLVVLLGYNKKTAFAVSIGSILVGSICSLCGNNIGLVNKAVFSISLKKEIFVKIILFLMVTFLYINLVLSHSNDKKDKADVIFYDKERTKKSTLPLKILMIFTFIVLVLGVYDFEAIGFKFFTNIHKSLMNFDVNGFKIFEGLFSGINGLGSWTNYDITIFIIIMSIIISWIYTISIKDICKGIKEGIIKTYKPALYAIISSLVFTITLSSQSNIMETINNSIITSDFSIMKTSLGTLASSIFSNDYNYIMNSGFGQALLLNGKNNYIIISIITGGLHSLSMLILPTSLILVPGLMYADLDYKEWLKYIWKFILIVFLVIIVISIILVKFL